MQHQEVRALPDFTNCDLDFVSNDYLGVARMQFPNKEKYFFSGLGSRLIAGNSSSALRTERFLSELFNVESALVFNSGYDANLGFFSTIPQKHEVVLYDQFIHASIRDGLRLCQAQSYSFRHNDLVDLEHKLVQFNGQSLIVVVEGVYSMDGDQAPLHQIMDLVERFGAYLVVDEAHSLGVLGQSALGLSHEFYKHQNLLARIVTFGKAVGAHGAAVLSNKDLCDYLVHACRSFIYTTALPPESYRRIEHCLNYVVSNNDLRTNLFQIVDDFSQIFNCSQQYIQAIPFSGIQNLKMLMKNAVDEKIAIKGVWSPTVPHGQERIRISLHAFNTTSEITTLFNFFKKETPCMIDFLSVE